MAKKPTLPKKESFIDLPADVVAGVDPGAGPDEPAVVIVKKDPENPELVEVLQELEGMGAGMHKLKMDNYEEYKKKYRRFMWLIARRDELQKGGA